MIHQENYYIDIAIDFSPKVDKFHSKQFSSFQLSFLWCNINIDNRLTKLISSERVLADASGYMQGFITVDCSFPSWDYKSMPR